MQLQLLTEAEAATLRTFVRLGKNKELWFTFDRLVINSQRSIYGAIQNAPAFVHATPLRHSLDLVIEELT